MCKYSGYEGGLVLEERLRASAFKVLGVSEVSSQRFYSDDQPTLVVIDNKLVKATNVVQPKLSLEGTGSPIQIGDLVIIEAKLTGEFPQFIKGAKIKWTVRENNKDKVYWYEARKVIFGAGPKPTQIDVDAVLTLNYGLENEVVSKTLTASAVVTVGDQPQPDPTPDPNDLAGMVAMWAKDPSVVQPDGLMLSKGAQALAGSFRTVAGNIGQNGMTSARAILIQTKASNNDALLAAGVNPQTWDLWGKKLQDLLYDKYNSKELTTPDQFKEIWGEIANGLSKVR